MKKGLWILLIYYGLNFAFHRNKALFLRRIEADNENGICSMLPQISFDLEENQEEILEALVKNNRYSIFRLLVKNGLLGSEIPELICKMEKLEEASYQKS